MIAFLIGCGVGGVIVGTCVYLAQHAAQRQALEQKAEDLARKL